MNTKTLSFLKLIIALLMLTSSLVVCEIIAPVKVNQNNALSIQQITTTPSVATLSLASSSSELTVSNISSLSIKLESKVIYANPGIIINFLVYPALERSQSQLQQLFKFTFSNTKLTPRGIFVSQGVKFQQIRVTFDYHNNIPFQIFTVNFDLNDIKIGQTTHITLVMDSISGGITSALRPDDSNDVLR